jgi:hypothetical protein
MPRRAHHRQPQRLIRTPLPTHPLGHIAGLPALIRCHHRTPSVIKVPRPPVESAQRVTIVCTRVYPLWATFQLAATTPIIVRNPATSSFFLWYSAQQRLAAREHLRHRRPIHRRRHRPPTQHTIRAIPRPRPRPTRLGTRLPHRLRRSQPACVISAPWEYWELPDMIYMLWGFSDMRE